MSSENNNLTKTDLSKKCIDEIADQVENRLKQDSAKTADVPAPAGISGHDSKKVFLFGAASGLAFAVLAPLFGKQARPAVRGAIKSGLRASRFVQRVGSSIKEDLEDLTAEARSDLDIENQKPAPEQQNRG